MNPLAASLRRATIPASGLAGAGDHGDIAATAALDASEEGAERSGFAIQMLRGFDEQPAGDGVAAFGDGAVITMGVALAGAGGEAEVADGVVGVAEAREVAPSREEGLVWGSGDTHSRHNVKADSRKT